MDTWVLVSEITLLPLLSLLLTMRKLKALLMLPFFAIWQDLEETSEMFISGH